MPAIDQLTPASRTSVAVEDLRCTRCAQDVLELIDSDDARNWLMLVLSAPIVWYAGWIFIAAPGRHCATAR